MENHHEPVQAQVNLDIASLFSVEGLVVVITGGATGIGHMLARGLAQNKAKVFILGRRPEKLAAAASAHPNITPVTCDITSKASLEAAVSEIRSQTPHINILINNAAVVGPPHPTLPKPPPHRRGPLPEDFDSLEKVQEYFWKDSVESWDETFRTNVTGGWFTSVAFLSLFKPGDSQIINISSIGGFMRAISAGVAYHVSKAAATHLSKMMATTFVQWGVRANCICPGIFPSEMTAGEENVVEKGRGKVGARPGEEVVPVGRFGTDADMVAAVVWMAGRGGGYLNGAVVLVDGGRLGVQASTY